MNPRSKDKVRTIMDRAKMMEHNAEGCPACGRKFTLGDPVVYAGVHAELRDHLHRSGVAFGPPHVYPLSVAGQQRVPLSFQTAWLAMRPKLPPPQVCGCIAAPSGDDR